MTNQEAIEQIKHDIKQCCASVSYQWYKDEEALDMAIKALEKEPCDDCVSKQEVLELHQMRMGEKEISKAIYELPSVQSSRPRAQWVGIDEEPHEVYECNYCGFVIYDVDVRDFKFCPSCGEEMVE